MNKINNKKKNLTCAKVPLSKSAKVTRAKLTPCKNACWCKSTPCAHLTPTHEKQLVVTNILNRKTTLLTYFDMVLCLLQDFC